MKRTKESLIKEREEVVIEIYYDLLSYIGNISIKSVGSYFKRYNLDILKNKDIYIFINKYINKKQGVYVIVNLINGKRYFGTSADIMAREKSHFLYLKNGKHVNLELQKDYNKYGRGNFILSIISEEVDYERYKVEKNFIEKSSLLYNNTIHE